MRRGPRTAAPEQQLRHPEAAAQLGDVQLGGFGVLARVGQGFVALEFAAGFLLRVRRSAGVPARDGRCRGRTRRRLRMHSSTDMFETSHFAVERHMLAMAKASFCYARSRNEKLKRRKVRSRSAIR